MRAPPSLVLFDLDGVLVSYSHAIRMQTLGDAIGRAPEVVYSALFDTGLEHRYDAGLITQDAYLEGLSDILGCTVDTPNWLAARSASMHCEPATCVRIASLAKRAEIAVLTNNGPLDEDALREAGITDFARYAVDPSLTPLPDLFL